jgi:acyl carrier protein
VLGVESVERVVNLYGPTEGTTYTTMWEARRGEKVKIGRGIANERLYILDEEQGLVGCGVRGEIYIGGEGLARGYWARAEQTAEKFVPDPYSERAGGRMYRTGDIGRWSESGEIEYVGRADHQVKVRGYRIELGEVEAVLSRHEAVSECVVVAREDIEGEKRLVAYLVAETEVSREELRAWLKEQLPEYMIPAAFVMLEQLPLTPNGKVDRKALPAPDAQRGSEKGYVRPQSAAEEVLAGIWSELLGVERVGVTDNFFELGGHSLLATRLVSTLRRTFRTEVPLRTLFESPTIAELIPFIAQNLGGMEVLEEIAFTIKQLEQLSPDEVTELLNTQGEVSVGS